MTKTTKNYNSHMLVPKHEKLTEKQKQEVLKNYNCKLEELPKIKIKDAAIKDLDPKAGDVFKIERSSKTGGLVLFYRRVVND